MQVVNLLYFIPKIQQIRGGATRCQDLNGLHRWLENAENAMQTIISKSRILILKITKNARVSFESITVCVVITGRYFEQHIA